jgi:hypothetical protein
LFVCQSFLTLGLVLNTLSLQTQVSVLRLNNPFKDALTTQNRAAIL